MRVHQAGHAGLERSALLPEHFAQAHVCQTRRPCCPDHTGPVLDLKVRSRSARRRAPGPTFPPSPDGSVLCSSLVSVEGAEHPSIRDAWWVDSDICMPLMESVGQMSKSTHYKLQRRELLVMGLHLPNMPRGAPRADDPPAPNGILCRFRTRSPKADLHERHRRGIPSCNRAARGE